MDDWSCIQKGSREGIFNSLYGGKEGVNCGRSLLSLPRWENAGRQVNCFDNNAAFRWTDLSGKIGQGSGLSKGDVFPVSPFLAII